MKRLKDSRETARLNRNKIQEGKGNVKKIMMEK